MFKQITVALSAAVLTISLAGAITFAPSTVEAKSFGGGRSFGGSSFGRSSFRSSGGWGSKTKSKSLFSSSKPAKKASGSFSSTTNKSSVKTTKPKKTFSKSKVANTPLANRAQRAAFKKPPVTATGGKRVTRVQQNRAYNTKYSGNRVYSRARGYDSSTYYTRRSHYYGGWSTPGYVYYASPSYGLWDTMFLYYMLSDHNHSSQFAYNHQNDADYMAWRQEADRLAADNADLRKQLAAMDSGMAQYRGQPVDPNYLPEGVDADIALSDEARTSVLPELRVCVGSRNGAYFRVAAGVLAPNLANVNVTTVETAGTGEILKNIADGKCDAGFVQGDGYWNYVENHQTTRLPFERVFSPYRENVYLICHDNGVKSLNDLNTTDRLWFPKNSGAAETWRNILGENGRYRNIPTSTTDTNEEALLKTSASKNACMLYVGAGTSKFMRNLEASSKSQGLVLRDVQASSGFGCSSNALTATTDPSGGYVYKEGDLLDDNYPNLLRNDWSVDTLTVNADFLVSNDWKVAHKKLYSTLAVDLMGLQPNIAAAVH